MIPTKDVQPHDLTRENLRDSTNNNTFLSFKNKLMYNCMRLQILKGKIINFTHEISRKSSKPTIKRD